MTESVTLPSKVVLTGIDASAERFQRSWYKLPPEVRKEASKLLGQMILCEALPGKLHFHKLNGFKDVWTIHITADDRYKASFKIVNGVAVFRRAGKHEELDKNPE